MEFYEAKYNRKEIEEKIGIVDSTVGFAGCPILEYNHELFIRENVPSRCIIRNSSITFNSVDRSLPIEHIDLYNNIDWDWISKYGIRYIKFSESELLRYYVDIPTGDSITKRFEFMVSNCWIVYADNITERCDLSFVTSQEKTTDKVDGVEYKIQQIRIKTRLETPDVIETRLFTIKGSLIGIDSLNVNKITNVKNTGTPGKWVKWKLANLPYSFTHANNSSFDIFVDYNYSCTKVNKKDNSKNNYLVNNCVFKIQYEDETFNFPCSMNIVANNTSTDTDLYMYDVNTDVITINHTNRIISIDDVVYKGDITIKTEMYTGPVKGICIASSSNYIDFCCYDPSENDNYYLNWPTKETDIGDIENDIYFNTNKNELIKLRWGHEDETGEYHEVPMIVKSISNIVFNLN